MTDEKILGQKFGRLTVLRAVLPPPGEPAHNRKVLCRCDCGKHATARLDNLRAGKTKSCGCIAEELAYERRFADVIGDMPAHGLLFHDDSASVDCARACAALEAEIDADGCCGDVDDATWIASMLHVAETRARIRPPRATKLSVKAPAKNTRPYRRGVIQDHPELTKSMQSFYKLTPEQFDAMKATQGGCCAICKEPPREGYRLFIDHCHSTGRVRGLLCAHCNTGLGFFKDRIMSLARAIHYLGAEM